MFLEPSSIANQENHKSFEEIITSHEYHFVETMPVVWLHQCSMGSKIMVCMVFLSFSGFHGFAGHGLINMVCMVHILQSNSWVACILKEEIVYWAKALYNSTSKELAYPKEANLTTQIVPWRGIYFKNATPKGGAFQKRVVSLPSLYSKDGCLITQTVSWGRARIIQLARGLPIQRMLVSPPRWSLEKTLIVI